MSDIRFNRWLHQSGTGGVYQVGSGNVGIGSSVPSTTLDVNGSISATSISSASASFSGDVSIGGTLTYEDVTNIDAVGIITAQSGIHIDDSIVHLGDTNTKIRFPTNDTVTVETAGTQRILVGTDGKLVHSSSAPETVNFGTSNSSGAYHKYNLGASGVTVGYIGAGSQIVSGANVADFGVRGQANLVFSSGGDTERLRITSDGKVRIPDNGKFTAGASDDLQIFHSSGENFIRGNSSASPLYIDCCENLNIRHLDTNGSNSETMIRAVGDGAVELYHDNSKKFETTSGGVAVTGSLAVNGNNYPTAGPLSNRNLIINGAMQVAQRGTSGTANGYNSIDRFGRDVNQGTGTFTDTQQTLTSGSPYDEGFRKFYRTASSSASTAGSTSYLQVRYKVEAQDIAASGWNYTDSSSYINLSFWVRASVTQTYGFSAQSNDGTAYVYNKNYALTANTWTKITQSIPGRSGLQFDNDSGVGLIIKWFPHLGSTYNGGTDNTWNTTVSNNYGSSVGTGWWTASSATFDLTGVQLEIGERSTPFEHESYDEQLRKCMRYYEHSHSPDDTNWKIKDWQYADGTVVLGNSQGYSDFYPRFKVLKRANPSVTIYSAIGTAGKGAWEKPGVQNDTDFTVQSTGAITKKQFLVRGIPGSDAWVYCNWEADAEL